MNEPTRLVELTVHDIAHGGEGVARLEGKAHFVAGAMPGEVVRGRVTRDKRSWARVDLTEVVETSPDRVSPPCPHFDECGGCQWQHAAYPAQLVWKQQIVAGQLRHLGGVDEPPVRATAAPGDPFAYRNRMDFAVGGGRLALRRRRSRDPVAVPGCLLMIPPLHDLFERIDDPGDAHSITLRASATNGETLAVVRGGLSPSAGDWDCSVVHRTPEGDEIVAGDGVLYEEVAGARFRITGDAFFQNNTAGAAALVALADEALQVQGGETLLDGYAGGGLFGIALGREAARVLAVEADLTAAVDFSANAAANGVEHRLFNTDFAAGLGAARDEWDVAVVDPPRDGLGEAGVEAVIAAGPRAIAYVSCDPASLARDTRHLAGRGYRLDWAAPVDLFPQTFHVETVARFVPA